MATLDPIRDAPSPNALIGALADDPALRQHGALDSLIAELVREASSPSNPYVGERRAEQAVLVLRVKGLVESVGRVTTLAELVEVYDSDDFLFVHPFWRLVEAFATDAAERQDGEGAEALTRAIAFRRQLASAAESLPTLTERSKDEIVAALRSGEILCDKAFHRWLALRHQVAARYESESAPAIARLLEWLGTVCRVVRMNDARPPLAEGSRAFHMPSDLAEAWFLVRPDLHAGFDTLLGSIGAGELSFPAAIEEIIAEHAEHEDSGQFFAAYFLERALRWSDGLLLVSALQAYRILPERPGNAEVRATTALRFGSALLLYWRPAYMKKEGLDDAAQLLETAVHSVDSAKSPRLVRDLHFTRARLLENVAIWQPDRLEDARREFEAGLAIQDAAHERNARGRALGGLANVLSALSRRGVAISPGRVFGLYDEAQTLLTEKDSINRAIVLNNYAVSLLEERGADRATNVEHALTYIDEALAIATPMSDGPGWVADAITNMYLTRGNTLRERAYGALEDRLRAARDGFIQGRRYASETSELGGLLRLNQAFVCKELFTLTGEPIFEDEAYRCLVDAAERLQDRPLLSLMVSFAQGSLAEPGPTPESVATARDVVNRLRAQGHSRELAWRAHSLGGMLRRLDEKSFRDEAIALLEEALRINGELHLREEAINVARDLAAAHVAEAAPGSSGPSLAVAETYLDQAARAADELWTRVPTVEWRLSVAASSEVHADLAWVKAKRGAAIDELLRHLSLAKNRELLDHTRLLGAALEDPRRLEAREAQLVSPARAPYSTRISA